MTSTANQTIRSNGAETNIPLISASGGDYGHLCPVPVEVGGVSADGDLVHAAEHAARKGGQPVAVKPVSRLSSLFWDESSVCQVAPDKFAAGRAPDEFLDRKATDPSCC